MRTLKTKAKMANGNVKSVRFVRSLFVSFFLLFFIFYVQIEKAKK